MPSVILVDDEYAARSGMARLLGAHKDIQILGEAEDVPRALQLLERATPDAVFLDVEIPPGNGFDLVQALPSHTRVIFVTAHTHHAPLAFEVAALDYLLKPVRPQRLAQTLDRLRRALQPSSTDTPPTEPGLPPGVRDHISLSSGGKTTILPLDRIIALCADGDFTRFHLDQSPSLLMSYSIGRYETMLPDPPFARIGRSLIVNLNRIEAMVSISRDETQLKLYGVSEPFRLGRSATAKLKSLVIS